MESMLSNLTPVHAPSIPDCFLLPADHIHRATGAAAAAASSLPVIDMSLPRDEVRAAILDAGKEHGFFQASSIDLVINHGVPEKVLRDMEAVCEEFFQMPAADKAEFYSDDKSKKNRLFSGSSFETLGEKEVVGNYTVLVRGLAMEILRLLCASLGLRPDYFVGDISEGRIVLDINRYPPSPDPSRTLGLPPHCDRDLITVLLPGAVPGLEVAYNGDWIRVQPVPNSFVVNFGLQLEVVTNGMLRSVEHRAATNSSETRTSVATFIVPADECVVGPDERFVGEENPARYRAMSVGEFKRTHNVVNLGSSFQSTNLKNNQKCT
ncbi:hypothetical protein HU200_019966 [Digitaria exilis]|uniref:Fe2OG dioxygenase domain-containing protein n=1 Tax=Digitaria exilis TaxID=1010633 RepID=A0A835F178_9POAL|nr:hypothetical protein HU200_019966 [Digitaria exilis]CAB3463413.1 unnamed protein product [Digitaria exilis]